jgi:transposase-like protein
MEEIIDELKAKGKYDEWVEEGSKFGLTCSFCPAELFKIRPVKFYDVDGNIVNVSMVSQKYNNSPDIDNIAVFKQISTKDPNVVNQNTFRIVEKNQTLYTSGLATCTALTMVIGTKKFLTHLSASTKIEKIIGHIKATIIKENINPESLKPYIYTGSFNSKDSLDNAENICASLGIPKENYKIYVVSPFDKVIAQNNSETEVKYTKSFNSNNKLEKKRKYENQNFHKITSDASHPKLPYRPRYYNRTSHAPYPNIISLANSIKASITPYRNTNSLKPNKSSGWSPTGFKLEK